MKSAQVNKIWLSLLTVISISKNNVTVNLKGLEITLSADKISPLKGKKYDGLLALKANMTGTSPAIS